MTANTTPPPPDSKRTIPPENPHPAAEHHPPSQPASPFPKRVKTTASSTQAANAIAPTNYSDSLVLPTQSTINLDSNTQSNPPSSPPARMDQSIPTLQVKKLSEKARVPTRGSAYAAGYDLYASKETTIPKWGKVMVPTDISIAVPPGTYGRVAPRSGLASKHSIATGAGVIDLDYRGPVFILLFNHSDTDFRVSEGDRIAQLVLERIVNPEVEVVEELSSTERGQGGFGSTGGYGQAVGAGIAEGVGTAQLAAGTKVNGSS